MQKLNIDPYLVDTLMGDLCGHDRMPSAFILYLLVYRLTVAIDERTVQISLRDLAEASGLSRRSVQNAVSRLQARRLIRVSRKGITSVPEYSVETPWLR